MANEFEERAEQVTLGQLHGLTQDQIDEIASALRAEHERGQRAGVEACIAELRKRGYVMLAAALSADLAAGRLP